MGPRMHQVLCSSAKVTRVNNLTPRHVHVPTCHDEHAPEGDSSPRHAWTLTHHGLEKKPSPNAARWMICSRRKKSRQANPTCSARSTTSSASAPASGQWPCLISHMADGAKSNSHLLASQSLSPWKEGFILIVHGFESRSSSTACAAQIEHKCSCDG